MSPTKTLTITNPLVLYRALIATNRLTPDPAQHRLAIHLQKLYERLIDYEPTLEYRTRLNQLTRSLGSHDASSSPPPSNGPNIPRIWTSLLAQKQKRDSLALTRVLTSHEAALQLDSPQGLLLHGEVGTGKTMLLDLFADCLPNGKKRRMHFTTFMLEALAKLEELRRERLASTTAPASHDDGGLSLLPSEEYSMLWLARDLIEKSPILFLDEFQLPDRASSKIMAGLMTAFFQLGGVLIASSNRMPEELAKAAGMEFSRPLSRLGALGWRMGVGAPVPAQQGEFGLFLEVLKARCEVWEMEGRRDYRRLEKDVSEGVTSSTAHIPLTSTSRHPPSPPQTSSEEPPPPSLPKYFFINPSPSLPSLLSALSLATDLPPSKPTPWHPSTLHIYGRTIPIPRTHAGATHFTFPELCGASLGPAEYISLASTFHTLILTDVPVLGSLQKNEARRFITLLDALYEARCRLLVTAAAGPDEIFFPEEEEEGQGAEGARKEEEGVDAMLPETFAEAYQDATSPFRPNISSYSPTSSLSADALEDEPPNRLRRPGHAFTDERRSSGSGPDFGNVGQLTGEDERFAVKRAESRIWEMCSGGWWERGSKDSEGGEGGGKAWWRPLPRSVRHWEGAPTPGPAAEAVLVDGSVPGPSEAGKAFRPVVKEEDGGDGASPFRTATGAPPRISWTHVWGMMRWGKRAGAWGKGVEGLEERRKREGDG